MKQKSIKQTFISRYLPALLLYIVCMFSWQAKAQYITENLTPTAVIKEGLSVEQAPDGRIFIAERGGLVKVYQNNTVSTVFSVTTVTDNEQGLLGLTLHPDFATNGYIYVFYSIVDTDSITIRHRIEKVKISADNVEISREQVLLLEPIGGGFHNGGDLKFFNGFLYITVGDSQQNTNSQNLDTYKGKILRVTENGLPAPGNPFYGTGTIQKQSIWVYGFRNPWRLIANTVANKLFVLDVGTSWEEVDEITNPTIRNYGWGHPQGGDGIQTETDLFTNPIFTYATGSIGNALTNGLLYNPTTIRYPELSGKFVIKDFLNTQMRYFDSSLANPPSTVFFTSPHQMALGMMVGTDGYIYYCSYSNTGDLIKLNYIEAAAPTIVDQPISQTVMVGNTATFTVTASGSPTYQWYYSGAPIAGATNATFTIPSVTMPDAGIYSCTITNAAGTATSANAILTVIPFSNAPTVQILLPLPTLTWNADDVVSFSATATDVEDGILPASAFSWHIDLFHEDIPGAGHSHPGASPNGVKTGTFIAGNQGEKTPNVWYRFTLTVTDSNGLTATTFVDIYPNLVDVTVTTQPVVGLAMELNQKPVVSPATRQAVANASLQTLNAPTPQFIGNMRYDFDHWIQGGTANQVFQAPVTGSITYTAVYLGTPITQAPYLGVVAQIPGTIEAENYDIGISAYNDINLGGDTDYRPGDGVGTEGCSEGGYNIAWVVENEWLKYTTNVNTAGNYDIKFRVASPYANRIIHLEVDGVNVTAAVNVPNTGGFQAWQTVTVPNIFISQGMHDLRLYFEESNININKIEFALSADQVFAPIADFEASSQIPCMDMPVTFTSVSIGTPTSYNWDFGVGATPATATGIGPHSVIYSNIGTKNILLTVTNTVGASTKTGTLEVSDCNMSVPEPGTVKPAILVSPNPSTGSYQLSQPVQWTVYSTIGTKIKEGNGTGIDISSYATGIYFIRITDNNTILKIIKQ